MYRKSLINSSITIFILFNLLIVLFIPAITFAQNSIVKINTSQSSGYIGSTIAITGENFPGTSANIYWDDTPVARDITIAQNGTFSYDFTIPASHKGKHLISADDNSNWVGGRAETEFSVLPSIDIFPDVAQDLTQILIRGNGFEANEKNIKIMVDGNNIVSPQINADRKGYWTVNYTVRDLDNGSHTITASGASTLSSETGSQIFILAPWLKVQPDSGPVGTQLLIYGWGFQLNEDGITVTVDGEIIKVNIRAEIDGSLIVDGSKREYGSFTSGEEYHDSVFVPKITQGNHTIGVYGSSFTPRGTMPYYTFNVIPNLKLQPTSGNKGTYVTIEGTGFSNGEAISLKYDSNEINSSITADNTGSFITQYVIPQSTTSEHIFFAQGSQGNTASAKFSIDIVDVGTPILEAPANGTSVMLFDSVGDVYLSSIKYLFELGSFLSGETNAGNNDDITYFKWNLENAPVNTQYILQISNDSSFKSLFLEKIVPNNTYALTGNDGLKSGSYHWRVSVLDSGNFACQWSETYQLEVSSMPTRAAIFSIVVLVLIIAAIVFIVILLWNNAINKYKY